MSRDDAVMNEDLDKKVADSMDMFLVCYSKVQLYSSKQLLRHLPYTIQYR
jgi:hypothetical protein